MKNIYLKEKKITFNKFYCLRIFFSKIEYIAPLKSSIKLFVYLATSLISSLIGIEKWITLDSISK